MRKLVLLLGAILPRTILCTPIGGPIEYKADPILITGVLSRTPEGYVPTRREFRDLQVNFTDTWNLYLLGLRSFQLVNQTDPLSYYEIAGIHGKPWKEWQGAKGEREGGYCPHNNNLFFGWHRPYLALYEQELYKHVQTIASQFPSHLHDRYTTAAHDFRIPYWDWGLGDAAGELPELFVSPTVDVIGTSGEPETIPNPLYRYDFNPLMPGDFSGKWTQYTHTLRWPSTYGPDAVSRDQKFIENYSRLRNAYRDKLAQGFSRTNISMNSFSKTYIEDPHGWLHYAIGGGDGDDKAPKEAWGHMWPSEYSGFEPVFWLVHANVDRLFTLFTTLHPSTRITPQATNTSNMWIAPGSTLDATTPLLPFWRTDTEFWTTEMVYDETVLGYAYPESQYWLYSTKEEWRESVRKRVGELYYERTREMLDPVRKDGKVGALAGVLDQGGGYKEWDLRVSGSRRTGSGGGVLGVEIAGREVGMWTGLGGGGNREDVGGSGGLVEMQGMVPLTAALLEEVQAGRLRSLEKGDVVRFLRGRLGWKWVAGGSGSEVMQGLVIDIVSTRARIPEDRGMLVEYEEDWEVHEVISGMGGGFV
ncbi:Di-copper centre-containing protein [Sporormia fimetaria CBS 119925]|uniref:tyrosinase n=1 Tax=Sporormia fimetaria CBS 119925 TaxID=1340428 RepID=A0A6A6VLY7_9PLEO|nr:Di-copper centre-containing protein [Sporormia fimetaria CBS 119925]